MDLQRTLAEGVVVARMLHTPHSRSESLIQGHLYNTFDLNCSFIQYPLDSTCSTASKLEMSQYLVYLIRTFQNL